jgi:hypothetical protein
VFLNFIPKCHACIAHVSTGAGATTSCITHIAYLSHKRIIIWHMEEYLHNLREGLHNNNNKNKKKNVLVKIFHHQCSL